MELLIELDEEYVKAIDKIRFLVGGRTNRKLQLEIIKAIKNGKALEQEPTTKNDFVSRAEVLKLMKDNWHTHNGDWAMQESMDDIRALPLVTLQEPRKGHWIMTSDYFTGAYESIDYVKCSCCGEDSLEEGNYCPNCGAKMVEPQKSEVEDGKID